MKLTAKQLARILVLHVDEESDRQITKSVKDFVSFLHSEGLMSLWRDIEQEIHVIWKEKYGASRVRIISAHAFSKEALDTIATLTKGADISQTVDARLIGGAVIRIDDKRIDGSISGTLRRLKTTLAS